ncbi:hypothetical protein FOA52_002626 [Chlamydomonas sp. UWO 241]|nr:hypothetical protein FOA52_002626 [Chlamydomonas sp. UWO 241]
MDDDEAPSGVDYYAVLNVPRDCSQEDVARAYRDLARVFHPDKHQDDELKAGAQEAFAKLQEAYGVLGDIKKRQVYDIYGRAGLASGMEVGEWLHNASDLKREWEEFKAKQAREAEERTTAIKGLYQIRIDATDVWRRMPSVRSIVVTNSVDASMGESDAVRVQGQAAVRNQTGSGQVVCGYTRIISQHDSFDTSVVLGLRSLLTATSTRQVGTHTSASATVLWGPADGFGLQLSSTRAMPWGCSGTFGWVLGPTGAEGMSLTIARRGTKTAVQGKVEVGAATTLSVRGTLMVNDAVNIRTTARLGSTGVDLEVGATQRFGEGTVGYLGTQVGLQGVVVKVRVSRSNQVIEFPIQVSHAYDDWRVLVAATAGPPLLYVAASRLLVRPLLRWSRERTQRRMREENATEVGARLKCAAQERSLLQPVALRKARAEVGRQGLVILDAAYGDVHAYAEGAALEWRDGQDAPAVAAPAAAAAAADDSSEPLVGAGSGGSGRPAGGSGGSDQSSGGVSGAPASTQLPDIPPWLVVTDALQYLVASSTLLLHPGVSKVGLMAFADPCMGNSSSGSSSSSQLYVAYWLRGQVYSVVVDDLAGLRLGGEPVVAGAADQSGPSGTAATAQGGGGAGTAGGSARGVDSSGSGAAAAAAAPAVTGELVADRRHAAWLVARAAERLSVPASTLADQPK